MIRERDELVENIRIIKGVLDEERAFANPDQVKRMIEKRREAIADLEQQIEAIELRAAAAPNRVKSHTQDLRKATKKLKHHDHRREIERLKKLMAEVNTS